MENNEKTAGAIALLEAQAEKLDAKDFNLNAWKKHTILLLTRLFGEKDPKIAQIEKLDFEFNSWALRDASGNESYIAGRKRIGRETLEAAISELKLFGLPGDKNQNQDATLASNIASLIFDELKGSDVRRIKEVLQSDGSSEELGRRLRELLEALDEKAMRQVLAAILLNEQLRSSLKS